MPSQQQGPPPRKNLDRFVYYFAGVAIGCLMLGMLTQARSCQARRSGAGQEPAGVTGPGVPPAVPAGATQPSAPNGVSDPQTKP
jgi:hypothetical protein